jgi:8-oxo-dGTP pyrophosphatase MutT (NUDIX family)
MSNYERELIRNATFEELWTYLWGEQIGIQYRGEERISRDKYDALKSGIEAKKTYNLEIILEESESTWKDTEWGFPKGRRNYQEKDLGCALREFEEETGFLRENVHLVQNIIPYEEIFTGSNMKSYKHKYFVGHISHDVKPTNSYQACEVSDMKWLEFEECIEYIRPYNVEKMSILTKINNILKNYNLY